MLPIGNGGVSTASEKRPVPSPLPVAVAAKKNRWPRLQDRSHRKEKENYHARVRLHWSLEL
jgi:hypothetical protein